MVFKREEDLGSGLEGILLKQVANTIYCVYNHGKFIFKES